MGSLRKPSKKKKSSSFADLIKTSGSLKNNIKDTPKNLKSYLSDNIDLRGGTSWKQDYFSNRTL